MKWFDRRGEDMVVRDFGLRRQRAMDTMGPGGHSGGPHPSSSSQVVADDDAARRFQVEEADQSSQTTDEATHRLGRASYLCDLRHDADQTSTGAAPVVEPGVVSRWRMKDRVSVPKCSFHMRQIQWDSLALSLMSRV